MSVNIRKLAVGIEDVDHIIAVQAQRLKDHGRVFAYTRNTPKRKDELLNGGSLYWVIKGQFRVRQQIIGFDEGVNEEGRKYCLILLDPELVRTEMMGQKPFQGWRYLEDSAAPRDQKETGAHDDELPEEMQAELRELGLI